MAAIEEALREEGELGGIAQRGAAAVEVRAEADVLWSGDLDDVLDVIEDAFDEGARRIGRRGAAALPGTGIDEVRDVADTDDAAVLGEGAQLVVGQAADV